MRSVLTCLAAGALLLLATPAEAQSNLGQLGYVRQSLDGIELALQNERIDNTGIPQFTTLRDQGSRDFSVRLTRAGYIAVGCDSDCRSVGLGLVSGGVVGPRDYGERGAYLYVREAGIYTVRVQVSDCRETYCYVGVVPAY